MKYDNEELVSIADGVESSLKLALSELECVNEYEDVYQLVEDALKTLYLESREYIEAYNKECDEDSDEQNLEYQRAKI